MKGKAHRYSAGVATTILLTALTSWSVLATGEKNVRLYGALVVEPCVISPGEEEILLDFGTVIDTYLYLNGRSNSKPFQLHLMDCDIELGNTLKITFSGKESTVLPGFLKLDADSEAGGIVIGLVNRDGQALPLNQQSRGIAITDGNNVITLQAYVKAEPGALANKQIARGIFSTVATFTLEYE